MLYILAGPDDFSLNESLQGIKRSLGDPAVLATSTTAIEGQKVGADELRHACETIPFLTEKRLVVIYGLIERFEGRNRSERPKGRGAQQDPAPYVDCLSNMPESTIAVMVETEVPSLAKGAFKELAAKAEVKTFPLLKEPMLRPWIQKRITDLGGSISPAAVNLLSQMVGSNLWAMANEADKLVAFAGGRGIEVDDVKALVGYTQDVSVFALIDAIVDFRTESAEQVLQHLLRQGAAPVYLLFMLDRQFRMIIMAKEMKSHGKQDDQIKSGLGLFNDFAYRRTVEQAGRYSLTRLKQIYQQLLDADLSLKTGRLDGDVALNLLVADLCHRRMARTTRSGIRTGVWDE